MSGSLPRAVIPLTGDYIPIAAIDRDKRDEREQPRKTEQKTDTGDSFRDVFLQKWRETQ